MTDKLHKFVQFQGKPWDLIAELKVSNAFEGHAVATQTIEDMEKLFTYLGAIG